MPVKLSTTISKIDSLSNSVNSKLILELCHYMKSNGVSDSHINNTLKTNENWNLQSDYQNGVNWMRTRGSYKFFSDKIFSKLLKKGSLEVPLDVSALAKEVKISHNVEISEDRIPRIVSKLAQQGLIYKSGKIISLTSKGKKRYMLTK